MYTQQDILQGAFYNYLYIDHGAQFRVYAMLTRDNKPTGRVVKVPLEFTESRQVLAGHLYALGYDDATIDMTVHKLLLKKQQLPRLLQGMYANDSRLMKALGNTKIVPQLASASPNEPSYLLPIHYTQDHVTPMSHYMHSFRFAHLPPYQVEMKRVRALQKLFSNIVSLHYKLWEYGIFELSFKLENIGIRSDGVSVVLIDAGEYTLHFNDALARLAEQPWLYALQAEKTDHLFLPPFLHQYYTDTLNRAFTAENLHKCWQRKSLRLERNYKTRMRLREFLTFDQTQEMAMWVKRQNTRSFLYTGVPENRIDDLQIPNADVVLLLRDRRISVLRSSIRAQEQAERSYFRQQLASGDQTLRVFLQELLEKSEST